MTATFQGIGTLQFSPDNKFAQFLSGSVDTPASSTQTVDLADFTTGSYFLRMQLAAQAFSNTTDNIEYQIIFNDVQIERIYYLQGYAAYRDARTDYYYLIPPFTNVIVKGRNDGSSTAIPIGVMMSGTVHGAIEQLDLEVEQ